MKYTESAYKTLAARLNREYHYETYRMWHHVPFIGKTALVVDTVVRGGGFKLLPPQAFGTRLGERYIADAVMNDAFSLGEFNLNGKKKSFATWRSRVGQYPPGFYTHWVGPEPEKLTETAVDELAAPAHT